MNEQIESLAIEKDFASLSTAEQEIVLAEMPQEEYEHWRSVLLSTRLMDARVKPSAQLRAQLLEKMTAGPSPSLLRQTLAARMPVWLVAAALLLLLLAFWRSKPETIQQKNVQEVLVRVDTVWQEKIVWRERVVWREKVGYKEKAAAEPVALVPEKKATPALEIEFSEPLFTESKVGTSLGDAPELMRFFTQGDK